MVTFTSGVTLGSGLTINAGALLPVNLENATTSGIATNQAYFLEDDGGAYVKLQGTMELLPNQWKVDSSPSSLYEARMGSLSPGPGSTDGSSAFDTWLSLGTSRRWFLASGVDTTRTGLVEIRLASSGVVLASATITFRSGLG
jgi:hypothetical protein